jgi:hypothetical protein
MTDKQTEKTPLIKEYDGEEEELSACGATLACNPRRPLHRYLVLIIMCFLSFGKIPFHFLLNYESDVKSRCALDSNSFPHHCIDEWNNLPEDIVIKESIYLPLMSNPSRGRRLQLHRGYSTISTM